MSLFGFLAEVVLLPVSVATAATKGVVRTTAKVVSLDVEGAVDEAARGASDSLAAAEDALEKAVDETEC